MNKIDYSDEIKNYYYYLEFIEFLKPDKFLDLIINSVIQYENDIRKAINEYGFYEAQIVIDKLINENYNKDIINEWTKGLISKLENYLKIQIRNNIC